MNDVNAPGFYGSDVPDNTLKWLLTSLILHLAEYVSKTPIMRYFRKTEQLMQTLC